MTAVNKIDANSTGLRFARETSLKVLPGAQTVWHPAEPNSYKDFGGDYKKVARSPINASRMQKKGVTVDEDASGGFQGDLTYESTQDFIEGLMYAAFRAKGDLPSTGVSGTGFTVAANGTAYHAGDIVFASGFTLPGNNGAKVVTASTGTEVSAAGLTAEANPGKITRAGFQFAAGDLAVTVAGGLTTIASTVADLTEMGVIPGEWIYIGGDGAAFGFATAANNGFARVKSCTAHALVLDKTNAPMVADVGTGKTVRIYLGRVVKNESDPSLIERTTYTLERTLGAPDDASTAQQAEYLAGSGMNEWVLTLNTADKVTWELTTVSANYFTASAEAGLLPGTRPNPPQSDAYNTTLNVKRAALAVVGDATALYGELSVAALTVNNNIKPNKAIGVLGAFDFSAGNFDVSATATAYFSNVAALDAIRDNADVSMDIIFASDNKGIAYDMPLVALGGGRLAVASNEAITLPLTITAANGVDVDPNMDHVLLITFFDYLPNAAM